MKSGWFVLCPLLAIVVIAILALAALFSQLGPASSASVSQNIIQRQSQSQQRQSLSENQSMLMPKSQIPDDEFLVAENNKNVADYTRIGCYRPRLRKTCECNRCFHHFTLFGESWERSCLSILDIARKNAHP